MAGIFYGAVTLRQLAMNGAGSTPALRITDGPRFPWRGAMLDCVRTCFV
ncbi:MAG: hypothetical protein NT080_07505 [Spirochaetes bacterium]|nr:hypothetical protein [Spirochaetota bacterium]